MYSHCDLFVKLFCNLIEEKWGRNELDIYFYVTELMNKVPYGKIHKDSHGYNYMDSLRTEVLVRRISKDMNFGNVIEYIIINIEI